MNISTKRGLSINGANDTIEVVSPNYGISLQGPVTGTANLVKTGAGTLSFQANNNTFTGNTIIKGGILYLGDETANTGGLNNGTATLDGGILTMYSNSASYTQFKTNLIVPAGSTGGFVSDARCDLLGTLTGSGTLGYVVNYSRATILGNWSAFSGQINVTGAGDFRFNNTAGLPKAAVNLGAGVNGYYNGAVNFEVGEMSGVALSNMTNGNWIVGGLNTNATYNGSISAYSVTKKGTGSWTLSNSNTYTGGTTINGGTLIVNNTTGSGTGTGTVNVNSGGTLAGTGILAGSVVINSGASVAPGITSTIGTLTLCANMTLQTGSKTTIKVADTTNDKIVANGTIILKGTLELINNGAAYKSGNSYTIFSSSLASGAFNDISPSIPAVGLKWNVTRITEGIISIDVADGLEDVEGTDIRVYPTLAKDYCIVEFGNLKGDVKVELIDQVGNVHLSDKTTTFENYKFNISNLHSGFYFVRIITNKNQCFLRKVIKI